MSAVLALDDVVTLTGGKFGTFDVPCPFCSPNHNPRRKVLRIWRTDEDFAGFACARCDEKGFVRFGRDATRPSSERLDAIRREAAERAAAESAEGVRKAAYLWGLRQPISGSPAERYLREGRGYHGPIPATLGFLRPRKGGHHPAMIAAFAQVDEPEPGVLGAPRSVAAIHLTFLTPDGHKADCEPAKIIVGKGATGVPIVLAPPNDLLGLAITEGIEDALSVHSATGLGAWAAGCASRLPALADAVPSFIDSVTVAADADATGLRHAGGLRGALQRRGIACIFGAPSNE
jgi:hypothetical protein